MTICITMHKVVEGKYPVKTKRVAKFDNEHEFSFNIGDPKQWFIYLSKRKDLPVKTDDGHPVAYRVYIWGAIKGMKVPGQGSGTTLFPGKDAAGKRLPVSKYGQLSGAAAEYWKARK